MTLSAQLKVPLAPKVDAPCSMLHADLSQRLVRTANQAVDGVAGRSLRPEISFINSERK